MRQLIIRIGRTRSIIATTAIAIFLSNLFTVLMYSVFYRMGVLLNFTAAITIDTSVAVIVTPIVSWFIFGLVIEINHLEQEMRKLATYDSLTGLLTRRAFLEKANTIFNIAKRENHTLSVLLVDFDDFKFINDQYGHNIGDKVLASFGAIVTQISRKSDLSGRMGGEEFAFLLSHTTTEQAAYYSRRLQEAIRSTIIEDEQGNIVQYTISIGLVNYSEVEAGEQIESLLYLADKALYTAKMNGRDQTIIYNEEVPIQPFRT